MTKATSKCREERQSDDILDIKLIPIIANKETGEFINTEHLPELLGVFEQYYEWFRFDGIPTPKEYSEWLEFALEYINEDAPWFFGVLVNGVMEGCLWLHDWYTQAGQYYSVEFSGFAYPGVNPIHTVRAIKELCVLAFRENPTLKVIRTIARKDNRAAIIAARRAGFSGFAELQAWHFIDGEPVTGIMSSILRPGNEDV